MFSERTRLELTENPLARALAERRTRGEEVLDLTASNPTACGIAYDGAAVLGALADPRALVYTPSAQGEIEARRAVAAEYARLGAQVQPEHVLLTASTSEAYAFLLKLLCDPGDEVLVPRPSYPLFEHLCALESVTPRPFDLGYDVAWRLDLDSVRAALGPRTRALIAVSPNNPAGSFLKRAELNALAALLAPSGAGLICDEVFADYGWGPADPARITTVAGRADLLTFALGGLSKSAALPQMKVAWIAASGPEALLRPALDRLDLIADTFLSVSTPAQLALPAWLRAGAGLRTQVLARVRENRGRLLAARGAGAAWDVLHGEGGWYAVLRVPRTRSEEAWALELLSRGVYVHPGYFFDFPPAQAGAHLVVSLLPPPAVFAEGVARLAACFE